MPAVPDYALLDRAGAAGMVFFPRPDRSPAPPGSADYAIEVEPGVRLGARLYTAATEAPTVLYFHGNGEVVGDHDEIAPLYAEIGLNLFVVDFRGYGRSTGRPAFATLVRDAGPLCEAFHRILDELGHAPERLVMGRSLGAQPALEVAARNAHRFLGLIVESGAGNLRRMVARLGLDESHGEGRALVEAHEAKVRSIALPALLIHGERDELVPLAYAAELYGLLEGVERQLVVIPGAGHNDLLWLGRDQYFEAIQGFSRRVTRAHEGQG